MVQDANYCLDCWNDFQSLEEKALYCDSCSLQRKDSLQMLPIPQRRSSELTATLNNFQTLPLKRDRDRYQGRCAVRNRNNRKDVFCSNGLPIVPPRLSSAELSFSNLWQYGGFKTKESIQKWSEEVGQFSLRDLADATGHPEPFQHSLQDTPKPPPPNQQHSRPRLPSFRHSYPNIHSATQPELPCKPAFMPCLPKAPSILQSNEEVLVTSHSIQNRQSTPGQQTSVTTRPRAHTTSECKSVSAPRVVDDTTSVSYLQAILRSPNYPFKPRNAQATRMNLVLSLVNQFLHPNLNLLSSPSSPSSWGKLGLRVTSDSETQESAGWLHHWQYPESQYHHSHLCRDTPPTNPSSQMLETASDAISDLDLTSNCYVQHAMQKTDTDDSLYNLVGTLTQRVQDDLRLPACPLWNGDKQRTPRLSLHPELDTNITNSSDCQRGDDEAEHSMLFGVPRGRSRRRKPVAVPVATS